MRIMTASEASRSFSAVLDQAERGETIVVTRAGRRVATITPASAGSWGAFQNALRDWAPSGDHELAEDIAAASDAVELDEDPWNNA